MGNPAKDILGGHVPNPGSGTRASGYIETPVPRACKYCKYIKKGTLCSKPAVQKDTQIQTDVVSGLKIIDPDNGCCNYFEVSDDARKKFSK